MEVIAISFLLIVTIPIQCFETIFGFQFERDKEIGTSRIMDTTEQTVIIDMKLKSDVRKCDNFRTFSTFWLEYYEINYVSFALKLKKRKKIQTE